MASGCKLASNLVVGRKLLLVLRLEGANAQEEEVELIGEVLLKIANLSAEGDGAWRE